MNAEEPLFYPTAFKKLSQDMLKVVLPILLFYTLLAPFISK